MQALMDGTAVIRPSCSAVGIVKGMISRRQGRGVEAHQVRDNRLNPPLLVIEHDRRAAVTANAELKRAIGVLGVERLTLQTSFIVDLHVTMIEEHHMGRVLARHALTYRTMARMAVDRICIRGRVNMTASTSIFGHACLPQLVS